MWHDPYTVTTFLLRQHRNWQDGILHYHESTVAAAAMMQSQAIIALKNLEWFPVPVQAPERSAVTATRTMTAYCLAC
jgi:hypothetical protein